MKKIPETMRAMVLTGHGDLDKLEYHEDWPTPVPGKDEVLIKVHACGLNNTDVNTRSGWYDKSVTSGTTGSTHESVNDDSKGGWDGSIPFPLIQGGDPCGTVVTAGDAVSPKLIGKRCIVDTVLRDWHDPLNIEKCTYLGSARDGGFAEYVAVDARNVHPVETSWTSAELATIAISYSTAENMLTRAGVGKDDTVLIPGASGGVGSALLQLANLRGAQTIAMVSDDKREQVATLKPNAMLPRNVENLDQALNNAIGRTTVDVVADVVGGEAFRQRLDVLARGGRYTCSGAIAGPIVELDLRTLYLKDLTMFGNTIFQPNIFPALVRYIENDQIVPVLAATYPLEDLHTAQRAFIEKRHTGNIVVTIDD